MKPIIRFGIDSLLYVVRGSAIFYGWLMFLGFFMLLMCYGAYEQFTQGMIVTNYNDQVSWGLYEAQFVFLVGVAAAAVTVVFPSYVYHHKKLKEIVVLGEIRAKQGSAWVPRFPARSAETRRPTSTARPGIGIFN